MKPSAIAIAGSVAALAFAASPVTAIAATSHDRPATELRSDRSRDRHVDASRDRGTRAERSRQIAATLAVTPAVALANSSTPSLSPAPSSPSATVDWQIQLNPGAAYPRATGSAQYQAQPGQREFQIEVERLQALAGQAVQVRVNGSLVGYAKVSSLGIAQLDRNTELGQTVPNIGHGSTVTVRTATNTLVANGKF